MSSSTTGSTRRASTSRASTATRSGTASRQSSLSSTTQSATSTTTLTLISTTTTTITPSQTVAITSTAVPEVQPSSTSAAAVSGSSMPVAAIVAVVVFVILGIISAGVAFFLCRRKKRKQRSTEETYVVNHEPKRQDSYPHSPLSDPFARSSKADEDRDSKSPANSLDSGLDFTSLPKPPRSSRASSSIFVPDDTMTIASRSNVFLRPISLGEPIAMKTMQPTYSQMPVLPESPLQSSTNVQRVDQVPKAASESSDSSSEDHDDRSSTHIVTITRPATPEVIPPVPPIPAQLPPLRPIPAIRSSLFSDSYRRDSTNSLVPSRYEESHRPLSMASVYSTRSQQTVVAGAPDSLSPDVQEVLSRLKKRISTPWSINSIATNRTQRLSVTRASEEG
ncbi:hypothetical protein FRC07_004996 [Ceratobasidium sp. 392]|nr:hypothetical protein FRC07_004996 [Ceratobasidium sp. 392]